MILDMTWRYLSAQGYDYSEPFRSFEMTLADEKARDGGNRTINFTSGGTTQPRIPFIPEGTWNL